MSRGGITFSLPVGFVSGHTAEHRPSLVSAEGSALPELIARRPQGMSQCVLARGEEKTKH